MKVNWCSKCHSAADLAVYHSFKEGDERVPEKIVNTLGLGFCKCGNVYFTESWKIGGSTVQK